jgi:hypothetical protein
MRNKGVSILEHNQPKGIQPKMKGHKLENGVKWYKALQQKGVKQMGMKQGLGVSLNHLATKFLRFLTI